MAKPTRMFWIFLLAALMTNVPHLAWAEAATQMIPTSVVVDNMSRTQAREKIVDYVNRAEVKTELVKLGLTPGEVTQRLASLSDKELQQMATQMDQAMYGGDPSLGGILVIVLIVVLIMFLVRRI